MLKPILIGVVVLLALAAFMVSRDQGSLCGPNGCPTPNKRLPGITPEQQRWLDHGKELASAVITDAMATLTAELKRLSAEREREQQRQIESEERARRAMLDVFLERNELADKARQAERSEELAAIERSRDAVIEALSDQIARVEHARQIERTSRDQQWMVLMLANPAILACIGLIGLGSVFAFIDRVRRRGREVGRSLVQLSLSTTRVELEAAGVPSHLIEACPTLQQLPQA